MKEYANPQRELEQKSSLSDRIAFRMMTFIHQDLYRLVRNPDRILKAAGIEEGQTVLEVGCGPGFFTIPAARIVGDSGRVYALDINPLAIEKVQRKVSEAGVSNVETVLADAARTELPDEDFDLVFLFGLARPVGGTDDIWAEVYRLLKPGAILALEGRLDPPGELFCIVRQQARIKVFRKTGRQMDYEHLLPEGSERGRAKCGCRRKARHRYWH